MPTYLIPSDNHGKVRIKQATKRGYIEYTVTETGICRIERGGSYEYCSEGSSGGI